MSQLNKKKIIIFIIIWLLCLGLTFGLWYILYYQKTENQFTPEYKKEKEETRKDVVGATLYQRYDENDLTIEQIDIDDKKYYIEISGLKDKSIENKINKDIEEKCKSTITSSTEYLHTYATANFGNILSVTCNDYYLNYNLNTGAYLSFEELFTNNTNIDSILSKALFYTLAFEKGSDEFSEDDWQQKFDENDFATLEDEVFKLVTKMKNDKYNFYIRSDGITIIYEDYYISLPLEDFASNFAYFTRFQTDKSIFENNDTGKTNLIANSYFEPSTYLIYRFDEIGDYAFIDYAIADFEQDISKLNIKKLYDQSAFFKKINSYEKQTDKINFNYINGDGYIDKTNYGFHRLSYNIQICTMNKSLYQSSIKEKIYKFKNSFDGAFSNFTYLSKDDGVSCKEDNNLQEYFNKDFKLITSVKDIFRDDVNYDEILKNKYKEYLINTYPELTDEDLLDNILVTLSYKLNMDYERISIEGTYGTIDIDFDQLKDYM